MTNPVWSPGQVVGAQVHRGVGFRIINLAAVDAARIRGQHRVVDGEQVGQGSERRGVHRSSYQHDERPCAALLVVQAGARLGYGPGDTGLLVGRTHLPLQSSQRRDQRY